MNKKVIIGVCCLLLSTIILPVQGLPDQITDEETVDFSWTIFMFVRGKVENIEEETINDVVFYNCTATDVKYFWIFLAYFTPVWLEFERRRVWNQDGFLIPKDAFTGIIQEGRIFGIMHTSGTG